MTALSPDSWRQPLRKARLDRDALRSPERPETSGTRISGCELRGANQGGSTGANLRKSHRKLQLQKNGRSKQADSVTLNLRLWQLLIIASSEHWDSGRGASLCLQWSKCIFRSTCLSAHGTPCCHKTYRWRLNGDRWFRSQSAWSLLILLLHPLPVVRCIAVVHKARKRRMKKSMGRGGITCFHSAHYRYISRTTLKLCA